MLEVIDLGGNHDIEKDIKFKIEDTKEKMNYRKFLCIFTEYQVGSVRLRFDKMMLRFVYYPILGSEV
jgi:hypothetical protein